QVRASEPPAAANRSAVQPGPPQRSVTMKGPLTAATHHAVPRPNGASQLTREGLRAGAAVPPSSCDGPSSAVDQWFGMWIGGTTTAGEPGAPGDVVSAVTSSGFGFPFFFGGGLRSSALAVMSRATSSTVPMYLSAPGMLPICLSTTANSRSCSGLFAA